MKNIILMGTPHHANIGDLAIVYAEEELIKKYFQKYKLYIMQEEKLDICAKRVKKYMEHLYPDIEVISLNPVGLRGLFRDEYSENYLESLSEEERSCISV